MSVLIKDMEMPKACWECPLKVHLYGGNVQTTLGYIYTDDEQIRAAYSKYAA